MTRDQFFSLLPLISAVAALTVCAYKIYRKRPLQWPSDKKGHLRQRLLFGIGVLLLFVSPIFLIPLSFRLHLGFWQEYAVALSGMAVGGILLIYAVLLYAIEEYRNVKLQKGQNGVT